MDVYRQELNQIYASQNLEEEELSEKMVESAKTDAHTLATVGRGATIVTDASCDRCYIFGGSLGPIIGFFEGQDEFKEEASSDEDIIYTRIHPEDLVDKRLLEYEFFKFVDSKNIQEKLAYQAVCRIRIRDSQGMYRYIHNTTRLLRLSPGGKMWLILCTYSLSSNQDADGGISPAIINMVNGEIHPLHFGAARNNILSEREKEILRLIQEGLSSKLIADRLKISVHTVNRHRQNIISKLSVGNSIEAVMAAQVMKLL